MQFVLAKQTREKCLHTFASHVDLFEYELVERVLFDSGYVWGRVGGIFKLDSLLFSLHTT